MMMEIKKRLNQKGFTLVELMVVIAIIGVLAAIAIPKFTDSTAAANTAKIQADLRTIDSASVMFQAQFGTNPTIADLVDNNYLTTTPVPPSGKAYANSDTATAISGNYFVSTAAATTGRGVLGATAAATATADTFGKKAKTATTTP